MLLSLQEERTSGAAGETWPEARPGPTGSSPSDFTPCNRALPTRHTLNRVHRRCVFTDVSLQPHKAGRSWCQPYGVGKLRLGKFHSLPKVTRNQSVVEPGLVQSPALQHRSWRRCLSGLWGKRTHPPLLERLRQAHSSVPSLGPFHVILRTTLGGVPCPPPHP